MGRGTDLEKDVRIESYGEEEKAVLKAFITEATTEYRQENRQIPFADSFSELKNTS